MMADERMDAEKEAALRRLKECGRCNRPGTEFCSKANLCVCWPVYTGAYCQNCVDAFSFADRNGICTKCPCSKRTSSGACFYDESGDRIVCAGCLDGYEGSDCERRVDVPPAAATAHIRLVNGTTDAPDGGRSAMAVRPIVATGAVGLLLLLLLVIIAVVYVSKRRGGRGKSRRNAQSVVAEIVQLQPNQQVQLRLTPDQSLPPRRKRDSACKRDSKLFYHLAPDTEQDILMDACSGDETDVF